MASSLLALIDDIASLLDDVAVLSKVAARKTSGIVGDDLALNAEQVTGVTADRELPVVWAVAKGSFVNKLILVPAALAISAFLPVAIQPLLMLGGLFLCFEGVEKVAHKLLHSPDEDAREHAAHVSAIANAQVDVVAFERDKVKGAIRTDFVLSAEIVTITLGTVAAEPFFMRLSVLVGVSLLMTVGVYGLVAGIVKLDDAGLHLTRRSAPLSQKAGRLILRLAPLLLKVLSVAGTVAMFLVGGGILAHGIPGLGHLIEELAHVGGAVGGALLPLLANTAVGLAAGAICLGLFRAGAALVAKVRKR